MHVPHAFPSGEQTDLPGVVQVPVAVPETGAGAAAGAADGVAGGVVA